MKALAELNKAVMISSHILTELSQICTTVAVIEAGKILDVDEGTIRAIVAVVEAEDKLRAVRLALLAPSR